MGTRCLTKVYNENNEILCNMYRQYDGYPEGHGEELVLFLSKIKIVNGISLTNTDKIANGMECLAAQIVDHFKVRAGGIYLYPPKTTNVGEEYLYKVYLKNNKLYIKVQEVNGYSNDTSENYIQKTIFDESIEMF